MTNLEFYKNDLYRYAESNDWNNLQDIITDFMDGLDIDFSAYALSDNLIALSWLLEEHRILEKEEKTYLGNVIKPFKDSVKYIAKEERSGDKLSAKIVIYYGSFDSAIYLPPFNIRIMYKNMELNKKYTLEELEL